jgi:nucleoside-triphosphatase
MFARGLKIFKLLLIYAKTKEIRMTTRSVIGGDAIKIGNEEERHETIIPVLEKEKKKKLRIGIIGEPRVGKTTIIREVIKRLKAEGIVAGGLLTTDLRRGRTRIGFSIEDIKTGEKGVLAHIQQKGPKVGKYGVNVRDLDILGVSAIKDTLAHADIDILVVDEIGPMELKSKNFIQAVKEAIESESPMFVSVHWKSEHELVKMIKTSFEMFEVTRENRDEIARVIVDKCLTLLT